MLESRLGRSRLLSYSSGVSPTVLCSTLYVFICRGGAGSFWLRKRSPGVKGASRAQLGRGGGHTKGPFSELFPGVNWLLNEIPKGVAGVGVRLWGSLGLYLNSVSRRMCAMFCALRDLCISFQLLMFCNSGFLFKVYVYEHIACLLCTHTLRMPGAHSGGASGT